MRGPPRAARWSFTLRPAPFARSFTGRAPRCQVLRASRFLFVRAGEDLRSPLARAVGAKGYHEALATG